MGRESQIRGILAAKGLEIDEGATVGGVFIPDGRTRIYDPDTQDVLGEGDSLEMALLEAAEAIRFR